jgi:hypothetical protein
VAFSQQGFLVASVLSLVNVQQDEFFFSQHDFDLVVSQHEDFSVVAEVLLLINFTATIASAATTIPMNTIFIHNLLFFGVQQSEPHPQSCFELLSFSMLIIFIVI